jgi:very-short-patch-repair endonuclease
VTSSGLSIEVRHEPRLCYAMQQSAVPWLHTIALHNAGNEPIDDVRVTIELAPALLQLHTELVATVPATGTFALSRLDPRLDVQVLANLVERQRAELRVTAYRGEEMLAQSVTDLEVLAYNEWPGITALPSLLAAFVQPNHPVLAAVLREVGARVLATTGSSALDGYQQNDPKRALALVGAVHEALRSHGITYVNPPPSFERVGQKVRTPEQVLGDRLGTCLDLALLYAAVLEHIGLRSMVVLQKGHAFVGAWLVPGSSPDAWLGAGSAVELRKRVDLGTLVVLECTLACGAGQSYAAAAAAGRRHLDAEDQFAGALDVTAARSAGVQPMSLRTQAFVAVDPADAAVGDEAMPKSFVATSPPGEESEHEIEDVVAEPAPVRAPEPPKDRLEHWKSKLLDLTMFNRLLNFVESKKTLRLCAHDLEVLENRLQQGGRLRTHPRPSFGQRGSDPRDLDLAQQRSGTDVTAEFLAEELRAGRMRVDLEPEDLDARLVEIFRHARTSLEESGANTLYLAIGFLKWFESPQSTKPRRAPLLLLPITIERLSVQEGFRFTLDDAEPRINQTLLQMLHRDHDVKTGLGDTPPEDEHGVDVRAVLDAFRVAVVAMPRWEVESVACIGFFSFTKYLMWLDLAARDDLLQSPVLRHLVEKPGAGFAQDVPEAIREELDDQPPEQVFCPKDADSSQLAAVLAGAAGRTFVLEGPPGTGKSQTITNLVSQALANGKRVLFVAEKRAALEVVQRRLDEVGLGAFCLELHSSKSGSKAVLEQLRRALDLGSRREPAEWNQLAKDLQQQRDQLNSYVEAMHRRREHGISVFGAIGRLIGLRDNKRLPMPELMRGSPADVVAARGAVDDLAAASAVLGVPVQEPWWGVQRTDWTPALARDVVPLAQRLQTATGEMQAQVERFAQALGLTAVFGEAGPSRDQLARVFELAALFQAPSLPPAALLRVTDWNTTEASIGQLVAIGTKRDSLWDPLQARWQSSLLGLDLDRLAAAYRRSADAFFLVRWWRLRKPRRELLAVAANGQVGKATEVRSDLERALQVRAEDQRLAAGAAAAEVLGAAWRDGHADWAEVQRWVQWVRDARRLCLKLVPGSLHADPAVLTAIAVQLDGMHGGADVLAKLLGALRLANDEVGAVLRATATLLELDEAQTFGVAVAAGYLGCVAARTAGWLASVPRLREHCAYRRAASAAVTHGAGPLVEAHAHGDLRTDELAGTFQRTFLETWLDSVHAREPLLAMFRGQEHERVIARFGELDRRAIKMAADVVVARLCANLPQVRDTQVASSELGVLERELKKQRRHKPVRKLLAEIPGLLTRLAPCILMSPLSVAQYLGRAGTRFDLVVFDEASQIPMWDAVGAIGRGKSLVCVGDSRQLPPTTFFQRMDQGDDVQDDMPEDLESVLDECGAAGLPRMHLDWHYRSRHESLITFSNHHYYQNRLLTFPAPQHRMPGLGVRCVQVPGVYDRAGSRQNRIEAEALVAEVVARLRDPERQHHSLGIVTFSSAQQILIEDLLDQERSKHPEIEPFFAAVTEPVFVKNLENVQGDERDTILFSICYGPDPAGKVHENYGPLNLQGGERRLNVAITRARRELCVFSSVRADQIANRTAAIGARHLRTFLDYAQRGEVALLAAVAADPRGEVESPFEAAVRDELVRRGHEVHPQVGCSGYRIDLCVVDPDAPGRYLLGIECDGATYHSAATARDRDRLRAAVLAGLGWRLHRIWSTDFWQDPNGEMERVETAIAAAKASCAAKTVIASALPVGSSVSAAESLLPPPDASVGEPGEPASDAASAEDAAPERVLPPADPHGPRPYTCAALSGTGTPEAFAAKGATGQLREQVEAVLRAEAPVQFDRLARTIAVAWGITRLTERVRERIREVLPSHATVVQDAIWWDAGEVEQFTGFRVPPEGAEELRSAEELPVVEVCNAMAWLLKQHQRLAAEDLEREAARCFGITRLGSVVRAVMERGLEQLVESGKGIRDGESVRLP